MVLGAASFDSFRFVFRNPGNESHTKTPFLDTTRSVEIEWVSYLLLAASWAFSCSLCAFWLAVCAGGLSMGRAGAWCMGRG